MDTFTSSSSRLQKRLAASLTLHEDNQLYWDLPAPSNASLVDFTSSDYFSLSSRPSLRSRYLKRLSESPDILGSGGSRLVVNGHAHAQLENRLKTFFRSEEVLLMNSGYDANLAFFACLPQRGDVVVYDMNIHASVHDGLKLSRVMDTDKLAFRHNDVADLKKVLMAATKRSPSASVFVVVESVYSMDGTLAPLKEICNVVDGANGHLIVDEAHATGLYGPLGRGRVAALGLENRVLSRLSTFSKALGTTGAVILTNRLVRDYMVNFARPFIFTTSMNYSSVIAADCSLDLLEDGTTKKLADQLFDRVEYFLLIIQPSLRGTLPEILSLPRHLTGDIKRENLAPIIPLLTKYPHKLSKHLQRRGMDSMAITWPAVAKGNDRLRVCIHAGNTEEEVKQLANALLEWVQYMSSASSLKQVVLSKL